MFRIFDRISSVNAEKLMLIYYDGDTLTLKDQQNFYQDLFAFFCEPSAMYGVIEEDGKYISALRISQFADGVIIAGLETMPEYRNKGYAMLLVRNVLSYLKDAGIKKVYSHIDRSNKASLSVHLSNNFQVASDTAVFLDGSATDSAVTMVAVIE